MKHISMSRNAGFTLVEIIVVVGIIALLSAVLTDPVRSFVLSQQVSSTVEQVNTLFAKARGHSLASRDNAQWGVHLDENQAVLFKQSYTPDDSDNEVVAIPNGFIVENITLSGGGTEVLFNRLSGTTEQSGSFNIAHRSDESTVRTITISPSGAVSISQ